MDLKRYLKSKKIKMSLFCKENDINYGYFRHIANKRKTPSPGLAFLIEQATNGKVTRLELLYPKKEQTNHRIKNDL